MIRPTWLGALALLCLSMITTTRAADPRLDGYRVAPGYKLEIAATDPLVINPVTMTFGDDGRLFVIEWQQGRGPNDRIKVLTDKDGDGTFDEASIYMDNLELPAGLLFWDGWTYLTLDHDLVRFKDEDGDGKFEKRETLVTGFGNDDSHHRVSGLTMGPDGWIYLTTGDSDAHPRGSDGSKVDVLRCGGVFRCRPDGSKLEVVAMGMRNPWGNVAFDDEFRMFHTDNDNEGAPGFTGCRLLHVVEGGDYGWRLREGARCCQPDYDRATWNGGRSGRLGWIAETGRGAPAGLAILNSSAFPPSTRNMLIYPDVFRKLVRAYKLRPAGATFTADQEFELLASNDPLFRPDDAEVGPDGALYVLDWRTDSGGAGQLSGNGKTGRIYRMTWAGTESEPARPTMARDRFVKLLKGSTESLGGALDSEDYQTRKLAGLELIRRDLPREEWRDAIFRDHTLLGLTHAWLIKSALASELPLKNIIPPPGPNNDMTAFLRAMTVQDRFKMLVSTNIDRPNDAFAALPIFHSGIVGRGWYLKPEVKRANALALGHFSGLRRKRDDEKIDSTSMLDDYWKDHRVIEEKRDFNKSLEASAKLREKRAADLSTDLLADRILVMAVDNPEADPVLRDAFTRGLESLGPAGIEAVVKAIGSNDKARTGVALYALQGWRSLEGMDALLTEATTPEAIAPSARVNLFRALRELGPAVAPEPIAAWLARSSKSDPAPRAAAIRVLAAMGTRAILTTNPIVVGLLGEGDAEVRKASLVLATSARSTEAKTALIGLATHQDRPAEERRLAVAALKAYEDKGVALTFDQVITSSTDPALRGEALRALASVDFVRASDSAVALLADSSRELRNEAIAVLGQKPATALQVVNLFNAGKLPREDLARVIEAARSHKTVELSEALNVLMKARMLGASGGEEINRLQDLVKRHGNAERGRALYLDAAKGNCASCHRMEGSGGQVGPDLTRMWETLSFGKRVESILAPSQEIKEGYGTFKVATKDGRTLTGLLLSDTAEAVTIKDAQGREVRIPIGEVEEKGGDKVSLMPDGVVSHLSLNEFADLLAFLGDRAAQEALRGKP